MQAKAISINGHPIADANGVYAHHSTHEGLPVLKNTAGIYCYRYTAADEWRLSNDQADFSRDLCNSKIATTGALPAGDHTWTCSVDGKPEDHTLTTSLLVRFSPS